VECGLQVECQWDVMAVSSNPNSFVLDDVKLAELSYDSYE